MLETCATCREQKFVDLAESTFSSKRPDKALETAVCQMISLVFLTLGRDCLSAYDSLFDLMQVCSDQLYTTHRRPQPAQ